MDEFALIQEALKLEVSKLKDKMGEILIVLQYLMEKRGHAEPLTASVGHHNTIHQPQDINHLALYHPQREMVRQIM